MTNKNSPAESWILKKYGFSSAAAGIRQLSEEALRVGHEGEPPVEIVNIARSRKIEDIASEDMGEHRHAVLIPEVGGFKVKLNNSEPLVRQRYSLAHEIGHTYFFDHSGLIPTRPYQREGLDEAEERWCERFASEILMPEKWVQHDTKLLGSPSILGFQYLLERYDVSSQAAAIRIVRELGVWDVAFVAWQYRAFKTPKGKQKSEKMRVLWSVSRRGVFIPNGDSINAENSPIQTCYETGNNVSSEEQLSLGSLRGKYALECTKITAV